MKKLRFYKEKSKYWYADIPQWTGRKSALQMVAGADKLLDYIAKGRSEVYLHFSENEILNADKLFLIKKCWFNGADYKINKYLGKEINLKVWLCNVTKFVIGYFPEKIYFKEVKIRMENFTDKDVKDFSDKLFDVVNKETIGHMVEPENIEKDKEKSFELWTKNLLKKTKCN